MNLTSHVAILDQSLHLPGNLFRRNIGCNALPPVPLTTLPTPLHVYNLNHFPPALPCGWHASPTRSTSMRPVHFTPRGGCFSLQRNVTLQI